MTSRILILTLCFQIAFGNLAMVYAADSSQNQQKEAFQKVVLDNLPESIKQGKPNPITMAVGEALADPTQLTLLKLNQDLAPIAHELIADSETLDADPFFARAQTFIARQDIANDEGADADIDVAVQSIGNTTLVNIPHAKTTLQINAPLEFVFSNESFLFFKASENIFKKKTGDDDGQGLFFVSYEELVQAEATQTFAPFYFLPMVGSDWTGNVSVSEMAHREQFVFNSDSQIVPVGFADLAMLMHGEHINFLLSMAQAREKSELSLFPEPSSTAGFGLLFTGQTAQKSTFEKLFSSLRFKNLIPSAHADASMEALAGSLHVLKVMGVIFITSAIANYTVFKNRKSDPSTSKNPVVRALQDTLTTSSQMLTGLFQSSYYVSAASVSYFSDRIFPSMASSHSMLRKVINYGFMRAMKNYSSLSTNWRDFIIGVGALGGSDSLAVFFQGTWLNNQVWEAMSHLPYLADRAHVAMQNPEVSSFVIATIVANLASWVIGGSYNYLSERISGVEVAVRGLVRRDFLNEGKDPGANPKAFDAEVQRLVDIEKTKLGFPDPKEMTFNVDRMMDQMRGFFGYQKDSLATDRSGLLLPVLNKSIKELEKKGDAESLEAVRFLKSSKRDFSVMARYWYALTGQTEKLKLVEDGKIPATITDWILEVARSFKNVRSDLSFLTSNDNIARMAKDGLLLPKSWGESDGAKLAAKTFVEKMQAAIDGVASVQKVEKPSSSPLLSALDKEGPIAKWQLRRALRAASLKAETVSVYKPVDTYSRGQIFVKDQKSVERVYRDEIVKASGLYPYYKENALIEIVESRVAKDWVEILERDPVLRDKLASYIDEKSSEISPQGMQLIYTLKADLFAKHYREATIGDKLVDAQSPAQPGMLQRLRQTQTVKNSKTLTAIARIFEGHYSNNHYGRGVLSAALREGIPRLYHDYLGVQKVWVPFIAASTIEYMIFKHIWHAAPDWSWFLVYRVAFYGPTVKSGWLTTQQVFDNLGVKIQKNWKTMLMYGLAGGLIYTWTSPIYMGLLGPEIKHATDIVDYVKNGAWNIVKDAPHLVGHFCEVILSKKN